MRKLLLALLLMPFFTQAQIINTIAGNGIAGYAGDLGPATAAEINRPNGMYIDGMGNLYVSDWINNRVRKVNLPGIITTIAGTGTPGDMGDGGAATDAELNKPNYVLADGSGNIYISDSFYIREINAAGTISTIAGRGIAGYGGDGGPATAATLNVADGMALDGAGNLYVADQGNHRVRMINTSGIITTVAGTGTPGFTGDGIQATATGLSQPNYVTLDGSGNLYIADNGNQRIRMVNSAGIISTIAGTGILGFYGEDVPATTAQLSWPGGIRFDASGNFYIADALNDIVRKIDPSGIITTVAGTGTPGYSGDGGPATDAELNEPIDVVFDLNGDLCIADFENNRVRMVKNRAPYFTRGHSVSLTVCEDVGFTIDTLATAIDSDAGQKEIWSLLAAPAHGTVAAAYNTFSTGSMLTPAGLTYTPATGYVGEDTFTVRITDGYLSDTIALYASVANCISGVNNINGLNDINVFPNPVTNNEINITAGMGVSRITISNLVGQVLCNRAYNATTVQVDVSALPAGVYFVRINGTDVRKFVKE